jgi:hypothetical protein
VDGDCQDYHTMGPQVRRPLRLRCEPLPAYGRWTGEGAGPRARAPAPLARASSLLLVARRANSRACYTLTTGHGDCRMME